MRTLTPWSLTRWLSETPSRSFEERLDFGHVPVDFWSWKTLIFLPRYCNLVEFDT